MPDDQESLPIRYLWFDGVTIAALRDRLNAVLDQPEARLIIHGPFNEHATIEVLDPRTDKTARLKPLNEAHPCPPACG